MNNYFIHNYIDIHNIHFLTFFNIIFDISYLIFVIFDIRSENYTSSIRNTAQVQSMDDNCGEWVESMGVASGCG